MDKVSAQSPKAMDVSKKLDVRDVDAEKKLLAEKKKKLEVEAEAVAASIPDYVVEISAEKTAEKSTYSPEEVRAKARSLLGTGILKSEEREVLQAILDKE